MANPRMEARWSLLCKRTNEPKLRWLEWQLLRAGIVSRRNGNSFHAPILEVPTIKLDDAWEILAPVDDLPDDDSRWEAELAAVPADDAKSYEAYRQSLWEDLCYAESAELDALRCPTEPTDSEDLEAAVEQSLEYFNRYIAGDR